MISGFVVLSFMDDTRHIPSISALLLFLLVLFLHQPTLRCQESSRTNKVSSEPPSHSSPSHFENGLRRIVLSIALGVVSGLIGALLFAFLVRCFVRYINRTPILRGPVIFSPKIDPKTLQSALSNENQLLGSSPTGKYYRTVLDNGLTIAVKRLKPFSENGSPEGQGKSMKRRIQLELEVLASLRDRNLMSLRAYVRERDRFSLVYDYMPSGSLEDAMNRVRENELQLSWEIRLRIAVGVIKGLQYLHSFAPQILHYNLKPTNVMLDAQFEPRLADCALAKLTPNINQATSGYNSPECFQNGRCLLPLCCYSNLKFLQLLCNFSE